MNKFDEYKLFVEDTARFSERRQTVTNIYVAVNSIILTGISFLVKDAGFIPLWRAFVVMLILTAGSFICLQWGRLINKYKLLVGFRIDQLRLMEEHPDMANSHKMYHAEDFLYPRDPQSQVISGKGLNISDLEKWLPRVFIIVYSIFFLGFLFMLLLNW